MTYLMEIISKHLLHGVNSGHVTQFGIWNVLVRGEGKTNSEHHIAAIQPSYQVQLFLPASCQLYSSHLVSSSIILKRKNLGVSKIGQDRAERPVVDYGQAHLVKTDLEDHSCLLLLPELSLSQPSHVHASYLQGIVRWQTENLQ